MARSDKSSLPGGTAMLVLALLMVLFSLLEGMAFRETGLREGHGNFTWATNSSSFILWVTMTGIFLREFVSGLLFSGSPEITMSSSRLPITPPMVRALLYSNEGNC